MIIQLRSVLSIAQVLGGKIHTIDLGGQGTVRGLVDVLAAEYGDPLRRLMLQDREPAELLPYVKIYVNGRGVDFLEGLETGLQEGDDVLIMPQISGG